MHRTTRLTGILIALQSQPRTAQALADRFGVSRRTILRDVEELLQIGVPIEARSGPRGGYAIPRSWWLAPQQLTEAELETLLFALDHLGDPAHSPFPGSHEGLLEKLQSALRPEAVARVLADPARPRVVRDPIAPEPAIVETLRQAITRDAWVLVDYQGGSSPGERRVKPLGVHVADGRWYVRVVDARSGELRHFRVDRIASARRCLAPAHAAQLLERAAARAEYHAPAHPEIVLRLTERGRTFARDHADFRAHLDGDTIRFRCPPAELPYYGRELLRFGTEVTILGPPELRRWVHQHLAALQAHHS